MESKIIVTGSSFYDLLLIYCHVLRTHYFRKLFSCFYILWEDGFISYECLFYSAKEAQEPQIIIEPTHWYSCLATNFYVSRLIIFLTIYHFKLLYLILADHLTVKCSFFSSMILSACYYLGCMFHRSWPQIWILPVVLKLPNVVLFE